MGTYYIIISMFIIYFAAGIAIGHATTIKRIRNNNKKLPGQTIFDKKIIYGHLFVYACTLYTDLIHF